MIFEAKHNLSRPFQRGFYLHLYTAVLMGSGNFVRKELRVNILPLTQIITFNIDAYMN